MGTKLKKFNDNMFVRVLAFIMCVMLFAATLIGCIATLRNMEQTGRNFSLGELVGTTKYIDSVELQQEFLNHSDTLQQLICKYKSEENIRQGGELSETSGSFGEAIELLYYNGYYETPLETIRATENSRDRTGELSLEDDKVRSAFITANQAQVNQIKDMLIKEQLRDYNRLKDSINKQRGIVYFATNGVATITNAKDKLTQGEIKKYPAYMIYEEGKLIKSPESQNNYNLNMGSIDSEIEDSLFQEYNENLKVYLAFDERFISDRQAAYGNVDDLVALMVMTVGYALGCIVLFIYLMVTTGRKDENGNRKLYTIDRIWTELQLFAICMAGFVGAWTTFGVCMAGFVGVWTTSGGGIHSIDVNFVTLGIMAIGYGLVASVGLWFLLATVRLLKAHRFIKFSLLYMLWNLLIHRWCGKLWNSLKELYNGSSLMKKLIIGTLGICLLSATVFLAPVVFLAIIAFAPKWVKKFEGIKEGIEEVKNGNLAYKIPVEGDGELDKLAKNINEISQSSSMAVQNELKNQRLKTDLISNVSHDLKTPLTSMVTYIDLLKKEGLDSPNAGEYLRILDEKTERLRHLTEDLFEAAKASSGAMPVHLEKVELLSLINQGLGEMDKKIQESGLDFIVNANKEKYYVWADGQLLWRVVENLLGNVLKYAMESSRVYIDIKEVGTKKDSVTSVITLEMKNISKNPLNISADELMERFKRGDESRTTDGSGLGLAIAKDLVKLQNGWFEVFIDGDLFKAQVMLTKYTEKTKETEAQ